MPSQRSRSVRIDLRLLLLFAAAAGCFSSLAADTAGEAATGVPPLWLRTYITEAK